MSESISIHNSKTEIVVTEEMIDSLGLVKMEYAIPGAGALPYREYVANADLPGKCSLFIFLHGVGSVGNDNFAHVRIPGPPIVSFCERHKEKAVLIFPQCMKGFQWVDVPWSLTEHTLPLKPSKYMDLAMRLLKAKIKEYAPDPERIYAGGISMGGFGAWDLAARMPETFAGILSICGGADVKTAPKLANTAIYALHGDADGAVNVSRTRSMVSALKECGNDRIVYREMPGFGHNVWDTAFADDAALEWLFQQKKRS